MENRQKALLKKYWFDWETLDVILGGQSALDTKRYLGHVQDEEDIAHFLQGYGFDPQDQILRAELFGNFQEALQFIRRYFLREGHPLGYDLKIPSSLNSLNSIEELFLLTNRKLVGFTVEESLWAGIILKVMHTFMHADRDLRAPYFSHIQRQIFDRFYHFLQREKSGELFLVHHDEKIQLVDFQTKSKKSRDSIVIKLLHKVENVAEELFDKIGVRLVTHERIDTLRVVKFLYENFIILAHNVKPSRSVNSLIDLKEFRLKSHAAIKQGLRENWGEEKFFEVLNELAKQCRPNNNSQQLINKHTASEYRSIQFTCRQLIKYRNPFITEFNSLRKMAKEFQDQESPLVKKILQMETSAISRDAVFFYPFEVQVQDKETYEKNTLGDAGHQEYKNAQVQTAMKRLFRPLLDHLSLEKKV